MGKRLMTIVMLSAFGAARAQTPVYLADGVKVGEVTQSAAIVWTRLTASPERNVTGFPFPTVGTSKDCGVGKTTLELTGGHPLAEMEGSVPGAAGLARVTYWAEKAPERRISTSWESVNPDADFTRQFPIDGLEAGTQYRFRVEAKPEAAAEAACAVEGRFRTPLRPDVAARIAFVVVTCQEYPRRDDPENGHRIYDAMKRLDPDFSVHTGDIEYYDRPLPYAPNAELARFKWDRIYAMPFQRTFHLNVSSYFMKDDHDTLRNDCWPGQTYGDLTWEQGLAIFREHVPMDEKTYRTFRWGKDLQVWLVEGRDFRSPNTTPDGPDKTIWGAEQKAWFERTMTESDATFRVLISPGPLVGPDRENKSDNYSNRAFAYEGRELRTFLAEQDGAIVINGDRHWQYESVDDETGLMEFGTGPSSDAHAEGWKQGDVRPEHRYLNLKGGFLYVIVDRESGAPRMRLQHRSVDGKVYHEETLLSSRK